MSTTGGPPLGFASPYQHETTGIEHTNPPPIVVAPNALATEVATLRLEVDALRRTLMELRGRVAVMQVSASILPESDDEPINLVPTAVALERDVKPASDGGTAGSYEAVRRMAARRHRSDERIGESPYGDAVECRTYTDPAPTERIPPPTGLVRDRPGLEQETETT